MLINNEDKKEGKLKKYTVFSVFIWFQNIIQPLLVTVIFRNNKSLLSDMVHGSQGVGATWGQSKVGVKTKLSHKNDY